jgi:hypothetical protein
MPDYSQLPPTEPGVRDGDVWTQSDIDWAQRMHGGHTPSAAKYRATKARHATGNIREVRVSK